MTQMIDRLLGEEAMRSNDQPRISASYPAFASTTGMAPAPRSSTAGRRAGGGTLLRYGLYVLLLVLLRAQLCRDFPILLTGDSWDFIGAATAIAGGLDFSGTGE